MWGERAWFENYSNSPLGPEDLATKRQTISETQRSNTCVECFQTPLLLFFPEFPDVTHHEYLPVMALSCLKRAIKTRLLWGKKEMEEKLITVVDR